MLALEFMRFIYFFYFCFNFFVKVLNINLLWASLFHESMFADSYRVPICVFSKIGLDRAKRVGSDGKRAKEKNIF